jgi:hypothetical protein
LRQIEVRPTAANQSDLGLMLFESSETNPASWVGARGGQVAKADSSQLPAAIETLRYTHTFTVADQLGLVVFSNAEAPAEFYLRVSLDQVISFNPITDTVFGASPVAVTATASSGLVVTFTTTSTACAITPAGLLTVINAGPCSIVAHQVGDDRYNPTNLTRSFTIARAEQTIHFGPLPDRIFGDPPFVVSATASSALSVTFTTLTAHCTVNAGAVVTLLTAGECTLVAHQAGDHDYQPAPAVTQTFSIAQAAQTITFEPAAELSFSPSPLLITATSSSGLTVTFTTPSAACVVLPNGDINSVELGDCTLTAHQAGNLNFLPALDTTRTIQIVRAAQTITFDPISNKAADGLPFSAIAAASSSLPVTFTTTSSVCAVTLEGLVSLITEGQCILTAQQSGNDFFYPAPNVEQTFLIGYLIHLPVMLK